MDPLEDILVRHGRRPTDERGQRPAEAAPAQPAEQPEGTPTGVLTAGFPPGYWDPAKLGKRLREPIQPLRQKFHS